MFQGADKLVLRKVIMSPFEFICKKILYVRVKIRGRRLTYFLKVATIWFSC
jgi:hypothetical protein